MTVDNSKGAVMIPRAIKKIKCPHVRNLFRVLIEEARFSKDPETIMFNKREITINYGELIASKNVLSKLVGYEPSKINRLLKKLKKELKNDIEIIAYSRSCRVIRIKNFAQLQTFPENKKSDLAKRPSKVTQLNDLAKTSGKSEKVTQLNDLAKRSSKVTKDITKERKNERFKERSGTASRTKKSKFSKTIETLYAEIREAWKVSMDENSARWSPQSVKRNLSVLIEDEHRPKIELIQTFNGCVNFRLYQKNIQNKEPDYPMHPANFFKPETWEDIKGRFMGFEYEPKM